MNIEAVKNEVNSVNPQTIYSFYDSDTLLGHLVVYSDVNGTYSGGVRIVPDISRFELSHLARNMTLKYAFLDIPYGGAKAAITTHQKNITEERKNDLIVRFAKHMIPFKGSYQAGKDLGTNDEEYKLMAQAAGFRYHPGFKSGFYTALSVLVTAQEIARHRNINFSNATVAIEGFGKVGSYMAKLLSEAKAKVVAVSTSRGALYDPEGLDINHLWQLRETYHDDCVNKYGDAQKISLADLLFLPVDFLVPCAASWSITRNNAHLIRAQVVVCGANIPVTDKAKEILLDNNVLYFPDFASNSGGVFGPMMERLYNSRDVAAMLLTQKITPIIQHLFTRSKNNAMTLEQTAIDMANENRRRIENEEQTVKAKLFSFGLSVLRTGYVPETMTRIVGPVYFNWTTQKK